MKKYWLTLNPETFLMIKETKGLVYNSVNNKHFVFNRNNVTDKIYAEINVVDNLYSAVIDSIEITEACGFVEKIIDIDAGILTEISEHTQKPMSYKPILKVQRNINVLRSRYDSNEQNNKILENICEIVININGDKHINPLYHKQFRAPSNSVQSLDIDEIKRFMKKYFAQYVSTISIVGDLSEYNYNRSLICWINQEGYRYLDLSVSSDSWINCYELLADIKETVGVTVSVVIDDLDQLGRVLEINNFVANNCMVRLCFPVESETQYLNVMDLADKNKIENYEIVPIYNGNNLRFFESCVYTNIDDFNTIKISKREIFANETINSNFFGKLIVMPNGKIYANLNLPPIGDVSDSLCRLIYNELDRGKSWLMVRDMAPCSDCVYQLLCPSISNYELVVGRYNMCTVK